MRNSTHLLWIVALLIGGLSANGAQPGGLVERKVGSNTIVGYKDTPPLPATGGKYVVHDPDRPVPKYVDPGPPESGPPHKAPSDAIVLFDGKDLSPWQPASWKVADGAVTAGNGSLTTRQPFGDCQLHVEWMTPTDTSGEFMTRGNSGVILMGLYEIQIFDSHPGHPQQIYPDGQAASIYGQTPPLVNACRRPGQWQSFDILFTAPKFEGDKLLQPGKVTVLHNGVLVQLCQEIAGPMAHRQVIPSSPHPPKLPLVLQGHGSPVRFRNIWVRPLDE